MVSTIWRWEIWIGREGSENVKTGMDSSCDSGGGNLDRPCKLWDNDSMGGTHFEVGEESEADVVDWWDERQAGYDYLILPFVSWRLVPARWYQRLLRETFFSLALSFVQSSRPSLCTAAIYPLWYEHPRRKWLFSLVLPLFQSFCPSLCTATVCPLYSPFGFGAF